MSLKALCRKVLDGKPLADLDIQYIIDLPDARLGELLECAHGIRVARFGNRLSLCAIINAKSGTCSEDCSFCAQSGHHGAASPEYPRVSTDKIVAAGAEAQAHGVTRFGVVSSGKLVGEQDMAGYVAAVKRLAGLGMEPDLSPGILDRSQLKALKDAGLKGYHHNLE
ncbi:biotin synthase BioB, partial [Pseudodesulfovibrio sp.]|nr:biotin synthase BioB [Pseudodesulfovibrio sp.]